MRPSDTMKQSRPRHRASCLVSCASILIAAALAAISLFLPPINLPVRLLARQYSPLNAASPTIAIDAELRLSLPANQRAADFAVKISRLSAAFESADASQPAWLPSAREQLPPFLTLASPLYLIESRGDAPGALQIELTPPAAAAKPERPALYGWSGAVWRFIPSEFVAGALLGAADFTPRLLAAFQFAPSEPIVLLAQDVDQDLDSEIAALADILSPAGLRPTRSGALIGSLAPGGSASAPYLLMPVIRDFTDPRAIDQSTVATLIAQAGPRALHIARITELAKFNGFDGVFIDYRGHSSDQRDDFTRFIAELAASLSQDGLRLGVVAPAEIGADGSRGSGATDWRRIGEAVDYLQLGAVINPRAFTPGGAVHDLLRVAASQVARNKILLGLSARSLREVDGVLGPIGWHAAFAPLGDVIVTADDVSQTGSIPPGAIIRASLSGYPAVSGIDRASQTSYIDYRDETSSAIARVWLTDAAALRHRMDSAEAIAGIAFDDLFAREHSPRLLPAILDFKARQPARGSPARLRARWTVDGAEAALDPVDANLDEIFVLTLEAPEGNYAINWSAADDLGALSARRGAVVPLFQPTPTPTPTPTLTPTPLPQPVITAPVATDRPPSSADYGAEPPPAGSIRIEIGGHVLSTGSGRTIGALRSAGMTWMKIQSRFYRNRPPDVSGDIANARNHGFKILVGTVGDPAELAAGGDAYIHAYTDWLQRIAAQGADAIEVWNEPNLDREWPRGQISGVAYARMLSQAYRKIKAANGATMVISAAPAPTGAENAFPGQVMNDDRWLREMVAGGGLDHLDCVGAHYNEGIIPPSRASGDPRQGDYYTRYFHGMLNTYFGITGRPICFTELGYLTSEGLPPLPAFFSWAKDVTVQQQAAWLAQAAALASQSGKVPLFIVWNIDFSHYGADPQAGYAIIRPDGSCPACGALARAR